MRKDSTPVRARGFVTLYAAIALVCLSLFAMLAVDWGHLQSVKSQSRGAADAAALHAANSLITNTPAAVRARAIAAAAENRVDGQSVAIVSGDVEFGLWDPQAHTFLVLDAANEQAATAVRVTVRRTKARGTAVALTFGSLASSTTTDLTATSIATIGRISGADVPALACPWLAGMPSGSIVPKAGWNPQNTVAPASTPTLFPAKPGEVYRFAQTAGTTSWLGGGSWANAGSGSADAEGDVATIATQNACNGINSTKAPLNAMMGIFLNNAQPSTTGAAAALDFTTPASRDAAAYAPALKQVFFIGDGQNAAGQLQTFTAPAGATRLYVGLMDASGWWWDNVGTIEFTAVEGKSAVLVK